MDTESCASSPRFVVSILLQKSLVTGSMPAHQQSLNRIHKVNYPTLNQTPINVWIDSNYLMSTNYDNSEKKYTTSKIYSAVHLKRIGFQVRVT